MIDFIASVSLDVHGLILHLISRTLPAHLSYIKVLGKGRGKFFFNGISMVLGIYIYIYI